MNKFTDMPKADAAAAASTLYVSKPTESACWQEAVSSSAPHLLILGGTSEGCELAALLAARSDVVTISSLAGRVSQPTMPKGVVRIGGFGGLDGLICYLRTEKIAAVIDATHPFAVRISQNAEAACKELALPLIALARPHWTKTAGDLWHEVQDFQAAAEFVDRMQSRVFLSIGRQELGAFARCARANYLIRAVEEPSAPLPLHHTVILERGPFDMDHELKLLGAHSIDIVVSKNSGGPATYAKIAAARQLGIAVLMIKRPRKHSVSTVNSVHEVCAELDGQFGKHSPVRARGVETIR